MKENTGKLELEIEIFTIYDLKPFFNHRTC